MRPIKRPIILTIALAIAVIASAQQSPIRLGVHALAGGSTVTQNYKGCFPEISQLNVSAAFAWGVGASALFPLKGRVSLGTEFNVVVSNNDIDLAVNDNNVSTGLSNVYLRNRYAYIDIPVYISWGWNLGSYMRWNVDTGMYYAYGFAGSQKQTIYNARMNALDQIVTQTIKTKPSYFHDWDTYPNTFNRGDFGVHIGTGLTISSHYRLAVSGEIGLKNVSTVGASGVVNPNVHNGRFLVELGYIF